jgi:hypothetical protein
VTATLVVADDDDAPDVVLTVDEPFVETLVARLYAEYGADPATVRRQVGAVLAGFAGARVQSFVPILVEKRLREMYRRAAPAGRPQT